MSESSGSAAEQFFAALKNLRQATRTISYSVLAREAARRAKPLTINGQRLSDWFGGKAVPDDPEVVRFLIGYLQPRAIGTDNYQERPLDWWLSLHQQANVERQERPTGNGPGVILQRLGRPVSECDPLVLEVHPAIELSGDITTGRLPGYVLRAHDMRLREMADRMLADGRSRLVTLVGGSSTGKTRAGWELARYLEQRQPGRWRLWHPFDPTRPEAALADLAKAGPQTIVWLNEAQHYLMPPDPRLGERIAAGLRTLLTVPGRGPVLVLATLWPQYWTALTTPPASDPDVYGQARYLLGLGIQVTLADTFTPAELASLASSDVDPRLRYAVAHAEDGRITQYLAGAPALEDRYRNAPPAARAVIQVAMDARRLGYPLAIPQILLDRAAPGYLDNHDWDSLADDWLAAALAETALPCKGARGPLTRIRARPGEPEPPGGQPCYRLSDYLEQLGQTERAGKYPPDSLWQAFATASTDPGLLHSLGHQAELRGRYQHAIWLYRQAAEHGGAGALWALARLREQTGDRDGAEALYRQAADRGDTGALRHLAERQERAGDRDGAEALYQLAADRGDTEALRMLFERRKQAGDWVGAEALAIQAADQGHIEALRDVAKRQERAGDRDGAEALYQQAADHGDIKAIRALAALRAKAGDLAGFEALHQQAADHGDIESLQILVGRRRHAGDHEGATRLLEQAANRGNTAALRELAILRERAGNRVEAEALAIQAANRGETLALRKLVWWRGLAGDLAGAKALAIQAADRGDTSALQDLAERRERVGDRDGAEALYQLAADRGGAEALRRLVERRKQAGDWGGAEALCQQAADRGDTGALRHLAKRQEQAGDRDGAEALYQLAADQGDTEALRTLFERRKRARDWAGAKTLAIQAADHGDIKALRDLAELRAAAGDRAGAEALYRQAADHGDIEALRDLATLRAKAGDRAGAEALYLQAADHGLFFVLQNLARLRERVGDQEGADQIRRFGLTGATGNVAASLDFGT